MGWGASTCSVGSQIGVVMTLLDGVPSGVVLERVADLCGFLSCGECEGWVLEDDLLYSDPFGCYLCDECAAVCEGCNETVVADSLERVSHVDGGRYSMCRSCVESLSECISCGGVLDTQDGDCYYVEGDLWCLGCCERHLSWCESHESWVDQEQVGFCAMCDRCDECGCSNSCGGGGVIRDYSYKPVPDFHGVGPLFVGLELEIEAGDARGDNDSLASGVIESFGGLVYCKRDSSLNDGFEIVTHPMSPDYFRGLAVLERVLDDLAASGCTSWKGHTCGLHVHMTRSAFRSPIHLFAFALFFYRNRDQVRALSGRRGSELERYASLTMHSGRRGLEDYEPRLIDKVTGRGHGMRGAAVNLTNATTVEVRLFRGSLKPETVRGAVEFCLAVFDYVAKFSSRDLRDGRLAWSEFRAWLDVEQFPNLVSLCDRRGV